MPDLTKCPFCGVHAASNEEGDYHRAWSCGTVIDMDGMAPRQAAACLNRQADAAHAVATARLDALEQLAAEECGHDPASTTDPLEAIRRELARLRADADCWTCEDCGASRLDLDPSAGEAAVKAATSPGGGRPSATCELCNVDDRMCGCPPPMI